MLAAGMLAYTAGAQNFVQISTGAGYGQQSFYRLEDDETVNLPLTSWDIAFSTIGLADAAIHINEGAASGTGALPALELYLSPSGGFSDPVDISGLTDRLFNDEKSWNAGALNSVADPGNPFDLGWGLYDPLSHAIEASRVFALKLRDGSYKKFIIESLAGGVYTIRYANLDGSAETTATIAKADFPDTELAFFSFSTGETLANGPEQSWDLTFCRYITPLDDGTGNFLDYAVTGILSGYGTETVEARGIDPATVEIETYIDSFQTDLDVIGYDWKTFSFTDGWVLPSDVAYFVKKADGHIWKLVFVDFEGSGTGTATFEKTDMGTLSSTQSPLGELTALSIFPNPAPAEATLAFTTATNLPLQISIRDVSGKTLWQAPLQATEGFNAIQLPVSNLPQGLYFLSMSNGNRTAVTKLIRS
jgi:hypothetical protein